MSDKATRSGRFNVLLVEDNIAHAELVMRGFEEVALPSKIFHVLDGAAALDFLFRRGAYTDERLSPKPDFVLLDLRLPRIDGLEVLRQVKASETLRSIPVVVLTTSSADDDVVRAYEAHTNSYVVKPTSFTGFSQLTDELSSYWLERNYQAAT